MIDLKKLGLGGCCDDGSAAFASNFWNVGCFCGVFCFILNLMCFVGGFDCEQKDPIFLL